MPTSSIVHLDFGKRIQHRPRGGVSGNDRSIEELSWTLSSIRRSRHALRHGDVQRLFPESATRSCGRIAPLASQISQKISGSPRYFAAIRSSRSP